MTSSGLVLHLAFTVSAALGIVATASGQAGEERTALDEYVEAEDASYDWDVVRQAHREGLSTTVLDLTSQTWRTTEEVDRVEWRHWLTILRPDDTKSEIAFLFINGGNNRGAAPTRPPPLLETMARRTNSVVARLDMVPNQALVFDGDSVQRSEDDLIAYSWIRFMDTGDPTWIAQLPMTASAVRAMDALSAAVAEQSDLEISEFVLSGGSKRGWTTWLAAAVDERVVGIAPLVIDLLNMRASMHHHYRAYGFWAPAIGDYERHGVMKRDGSSAYRDLLGIVDPFRYRERLTMPKLMVNATGDEFFLPDSSQFYFSELLGEKHLCYVPNTSHSLLGSDAFDRVTTFYEMILNDADRPSYTWSRIGTNGLEVVTQDRPGEVLLWQATAADRRDFRVATIGRSWRSTVLEPVAEGRYRAQLPDPERGWTAFYIQLSFDVGRATPFLCSTEVRVVPDELPFAAPVAEGIEEED